MNGWNIFNLVKEEDNLNNNLYQAVKKFNKAKFINTINDLIMVKKNFIQIVTVNIIDQIVNDSFLFPNQLFRIAFPYKKKIQWLKWEPSMPATAT